jgi:uncharacterized protein (AIM24 family)
VADVIDYEIFGDDMQLVEISLDTGESFFITNFTYRGTGSGRVAFGAPYPGKVVPVDLRGFDGEFVCQKDSFLCAAEGVEIEVAFTKRLGAGRHVQASRVGVQRQVGEKPGVAGLGANILGGLLGGDR